MDINASFLNRPLFLDPSRVSLLERKASFGGKMVESKPFEFIRGVAIIPVAGVLCHDYYNYFGETLYSNIGNSLFAAIEDPDVAGIALVFNSGGGDVSGCFDLTAKIAEAREVKPIVAVLDDVAYSAAYCLACATSMITIPATGGAGSIGVIALRMDMTGAMSKAGVEITTIKFGEMKDDSYPTSPLSKEGKKRLQADVDTLGEAFCEIVARNRDMDVDTVRGSEAGTFLGEKAVSAGLADMVMNPEDSLRLFIDEMESI